MILKTEKSRKKINIPPAMLEYLLRLLSHDLTFSTHRYLQTEGYLDLDDSSDLSDKIREAVTKWNVFEYSPDGKKTIPIVDPGPEALADSFVLNPISEERKEQLMELSRFLDVKERVYIL